MRKPKSIDDYLAGVSEEQRDALEQLRRTIHAILPEAEECISYSMPAFRQAGTVVAGFLATTKGCSYYPFSGRTLKTLASDLSGYAQTPGALHFEPARGLPPALVRKLLKARRAEIAAEPIKPAKAGPPAKKAKKKAAQKVSKKLAKKKRD